MLIAILGIMGLLYLADKKSNGLVGKGVEIFVVLFLLLAVFVIGGGHLDGSGSWSLGQLAEFIWGQP